MGQFQVGMGVGQGRQHHHFAQIDGVLVPARSGQVGKGADGGQRSVGHQQPAIVQGRSGHGDQAAGAIENPGSGFGGRLGHGGTGFGRFQSAQTG